MTRAAQTDITRFKREVRELFGSRACINETRHEYLRLGLRNSKNKNVGLRVPKNPSARFIEFFGVPNDSDSNWPRKLGERFSLTYDGFDEDGNACWILKPENYDPY